MDNLKRSVSILINPLKKRTSADQPDAQMDTLLEEYLSSEAENTLNKLKHEGRSLPLNNPQREREILEKVEPLYFDVSAVDCSEHELKKLPDPLDAYSISEQMKMLKEQMAAVTKKIFNYILENYPSYSLELVKVTELQQSIQNAFGTCRLSRRHLSRSESVLTTAGLSSISKYRKRQRLLNTLALLSRIKFLHATDSRIRQMLEVDDIVPAIQLCLECRQAAEKFKDQKCISDLAEKLSKTLVDIERHLCDGLAACTLKFDNERYSKLIEAYFILNRIETVPDRIIKFTLSAIKDTVLSVLSKYCSNLDNIADITVVCQTLPIDSFVQCYRELLKLMWRILHSFHCFVCWHMENEKTLRTCDSTLVEKLRDNIALVWQTACENLDLLVVNIGRVDSLKLCDFVEFLKLTNQFLKIGKLHFDTSAVPFEESIRRLGLTYLECYHMSCLYELKQFLATEQWTLLPFEHKFSWKDLPEFDPVKGCQSSAFESPAMSALILMNPNQENLFWPIDRDDSDTNDKNHNSEKVIENDDTGSIEDDDDDVGSTNHSDITGYDIYGRNHRSGHVPSCKTIEKLNPFVCNASLNMLRLIGRYIEIATIVKPLSYDLTFMIATLYEYYFHAIYSTFVHANGIICGINTVSNRLYAALKRLAGSAHVNNLVDQQQSSISSLADNNDFHAMLRMRVIGAESLIFVSKQMFDLKSVMDNLLPENKLAFSQQFYSYTVNCTEDIRMPIYASFCEAIVNYSAVSSKIESTSWDISELMSQHSEYVDIIIKNLDNFLNDINETNVHHCPVPREAFDTLQIYWLRLTMRALVEGYSSIKKCTNEGRALMQLDFQHLLSQAEKLTDLKPIPDKDYVETYIKAYYMPESELEKQISEQKLLSYTPKQLTSLVNVTSHLSKKTKQRLLSMIENSDCVDYSNSVNQKRTYS